MTRTSTRGRYLPNNNSYNNKASSTVRTRAIWQVRKMKSQTYINIHQLQENNMYSPMMLIDAYKTMFNLHTKQPEYLHHNCDKKEKQVY